MNSPTTSHKIVWISLAILLALAVLLWPRLIHGLDAGPADAPQYEHGELVFQRADGATIPFNVEIATTPRQHTYGLMFRRSLPHDAGMIFMQPGDFETSFWMKNTFIPLDMLFVRHDGTIAKIVVNAKPLDLSPIPSGEPVRAIVEINGGEAAARGLKEGDKVIFPGLGAP
jgi:uncharacterized membrane protein (UPF0127 family)